ncbi:MAG: hypothetical protein HYV02_08080 [Deltaproteobacteria bacterium]|nr:hypothetical protein [Deltaproteobacteria bacterium]
MRDDITTQPIGRAIARLSAPIFASMVINSLWLSVDIYFLGRLTADYIAVATYLSPCLFVVYAVLEGFSIPLIVLIGRAVGTRDPQQLAEVRDTGWGLLVGVGLLVTVCGFALLPIAPRVFTMSPVVSKGFTLYALCFVASIVPWCVRAYQAALCGGTGHTSPSYVGSLTFIGTKVALQGALLWSGHLSISGIGLSTIVAMWISVVCTAVYMRCLAIRGRPARWMAVSQRWLRQFLLMAVPVMAGNLLGAIEAGMTVGFFSHYGTETLSALGLLERVRTMALFPAIAISVGISIFVSQHLGAGQIARAWHGVSATFRVIVLAYIGLVIICYCGIAPALSLLAPDATGAREFAVLVFQSEVVGFPFLALGFIGQGAFEGTGKTYPNLITLVIVVVFGRLLPYLIIVPVMGPMALRYILPWSHVLHAVEAIWFIRSYRRLMQSQRVGRPHVAVAQCAVQ